MTAPGRHSQCPSPLWPPPPQTLTLHDMALAGKWQVDPGTDSMEEWLKALGWNIVTRKAAAAAKPSLDIAHSPTECVHRSP